MDAIQIRLKIRARVECHRLASLLDDRRKQQMTDSLTLFVIGAIDKFMDGQEQHGGDICDRDLRAEIRDEQIDQFWYSEAEKWKEQA